MAVVNETTSESKDAIVGKASAGIRGPIYPSLRKQYNDILYGSALSLLWQQIDKDGKRITKIDESAGLFPLNAIRRVDFDSPSAYHFALLNLATEARTSGTVLAEEVPALVTMQGLPTGDVWLSFRHNWEGSKVCRYVQIFERSYAYDPLGASAYMNPQSSTALFAKKGTGGCKKEDSKATGGGASAEGAKASEGHKTIKCFGCGKKGHKKFECQSKHLWKENGIAAEAPKEKAASEANIVKVDPEPAAT
ncbi:hypothetical protein FN846DRAFT_894150 [Sphaerosporella brunnea]|uniref:CCHC-type domain-containing protein n=1 Tax=Sphaerosporella brunnea TaxID=1250544 RepID=A0A5J5EK63_9PEZI|nr:hypothetical protein FN846DRAFT_894150 [Sphaerosporella brunnea]